MSAPSSVYDFLSYKDYLRAEIRRNAEVYGYQTKLAAAAGCQRSFLSQALNSHVQLTPEHACGLAKHFGMTDEQRAYWIDLVIYERAGTPELREVQLKKLRQMQERMRHLAKRFKQEKISSVEEAAIYYSTWIHSAIRILLTIPGYRTIPSVAKRLGLSKDQVFSALQKLKRIGIVETSGENWKSTKKSTHLSKDSPFSTVNHRNWREIALQEAATPRTTSVHYTGVYSLSREDHAKLQAMLLGFLDEKRKKVLESPEEELSVFLCDFFILDRS